MVTADFCYYLQGFDRNALKLKMIIVVCVTCEVSLPSSHKSI